MEIVKDENEKPKGIYFLSAESEIFNEALGALQQAVHDENLKGAKFVQLLFTTREEINALLNTKKRLHVCVMVMEFV